MGRESEHPLKRTPLPLPLLHEYMIKMRNFFSSFDFLPECVFMLLPMMSCTVCLQDGGRSSDSFDDF